MSYVMNNYEKYLEEFENPDSDDVSAEAIDAAADSFAFVLALHTMFADNGVNVGSEPNISVLENIIDGVLGELAAASIFLSEDCFALVPKMLRTISSSFTQREGEEVPTVITKGFSRLADRIEATRVQQTQMRNLVSTIGA
jgi:hypothetical protein